MLQRADVAKILPPDGEAYFHSNEGNNQIIKSAKRDNRLKQPKICSKCNGGLSQPYDKSWQKFSDTCDIPIVQPIWHYESLPEQEKINIHPFAVKKLGCLIDEASLPIDLTSFSRALQTGEKHPQIKIHILPPDGPMSFYPHIKKSPDDSIDEVAIALTTQSVEMHAVFISTHETLRYAMERRIYDTSSPSYFK